MRGFDWERAFVFAVISFVAAIGLVFMIITFIDLTFAELGLLNSLGFIIGVAGVFFGGAVINSCLELKRN